MKFYNKDNSKLMEQNCPSCNANLNATTLATEADERPPKPGDFSLCVYCGIIIMFDDGLSLKQVDLDFVDEHCNGHFYEELKHAQEVVKQHIEKRKHEKDHRKD